MIGTLGWQELLIILVILALIFGASRVSDLGGALGRGIREFRSEARRPDDDEDGEGEDGEDGDEKAAAKASARQSSDDGDSESSG